MKRTVIVIVTVLIACGAALAQDPCAESHQRALVFGGGGSKGAFQAGAAYHLIVHRGCDFAEISGTSAGALNGSVLAQAAQSDDPATSRRNMNTQAEALVGLWESFRGSNDIVRNRALASLRFGLFGLEGMKNFKPLQQLLQRGVNLDRLAGGRELRIGTVSFHDGQYREIVLNHGGAAHPNSVEYLFASAIIPMVGTMPRIALGDSDGIRDRVQFGDGGLRHVIPITGYFRACDLQDLGGETQPCVAARESNSPPHPRMEQLFVVTTTPFKRHSDLLEANANLFKVSTRQITDGRKVMGRAIDVITNSILNADMSEMFAANDMLRWREQHAANSGWDDSLRRYPVESYNYDPVDPHRPTRPYDLAVIVPGYEDGDMNALLDFSPERVSRQLFCGCIAADQLMQRKYGLATASDRCAERFRPRKSKSTTDTTSKFDAAICALPGAGAAVTAISASAR